MTRKKKPKDIPSEKELKPFWNSNSEKISPKLWLPTESECKKCPLVKNKLFSNSETLNSWFTVTKTKFTNTVKYLPDNFFQNLPPFDPEPKEGTLKTIKVRIHPDEKEKQKLAQWFGASRWIYNVLVDRVNKGLKISLQTLREVVKEKVKDTPWFKEIHSFIRDFPVRDLVKADKTIRTLMKLKKQTKPPTFKFRTKKDPTQSLYIQHKEWNRVCTKRKGEFEFLKKIKTGKNFPVIEHDLRLIKDALNQYWICVPVPIQTKEKMVNPRESKPRVISIDPGVRAFATCYDPRGFVYEWGKLDIGRIFRLCLVMDKLISESTQVKARRRYILKKKIKRIRFNIRNLVDELHKKLALWLCRNYDYIILPTFESSGMVRKGERKISSKTARKVMTMSHYRFRQRLLFKATEFPKTKVMLVTEEFTSKTCGNCGEINSTLGSSKVFKCKRERCEKVLDRDFNGARNILLKTLTEVTLR